MAVERVVGDGSVLFGDQASSFDLLRRTRPMGTNAKLISGVDTSSEDGVDEIPWPVFEDVVVVM